MRMVYVRARCSMDVIEFRLVDPCADTYGRSGQTDAQKRVLSLQGGACAGNHPAGQI
jgi:hypothetical protein